MILVCKLQTPNIVGRFQPSLKINQYLMHGIALERVVNVVGMYRFLDETVEMRKRSLPLVVSVQL